MSMTVSERAGERAVLRPVVVADQKRIGRLSRNGMVQVLGGDLAVRTLSDENAAAFSSAYR